MQADHHHTITNQLYLTTDSAEFDAVYLEHYASLHQYAYTMLQDVYLAEEMVHQVFLKILERDTAITIHTSLKAYLYRAVNNECLNYLKHQKVKAHHQNHTTEVMKTQFEPPNNNLQYRELETRLKKALDDLPEQCRTIFQMSRFDELKYNEIAAELGIAVKTVENQMSKALKRLRVQLADYLPMLIGMMTMMINLVNAHPWK